MARHAIAARLNDSSGREAGSFTDAVNYSTCVAKWTLTGNGLPAEVSVRALGWLAMRANGTPLAGHSRRSASARR